MFNEVLLWRLPLLPLPGLGGAAAGASDCTASADAVTSPAQPAVPADRLQRLASRWERIESALGRMERNGGVTAPTSQAGAARPAAGLLARSRQTLRPVLSVRCPVWFVCQGHEGSLFDVRWIRNQWEGFGHPAKSSSSTACGAGGGGGGGGSSGNSTSSSSSWLLATAADDRSARLWTLPDLTHLEQPQQLQSQHKSKGAAGQDCGMAAGGQPGHPPGAQLGTVLAPVRTLWGHSARVWCCAAVPTAAAVPGANLQPGVASVVQAPPLLLVTGSEDCTVRLWDASSGHCLSVLHGHRGRGIWRCALLPPAGERRAGSGQDTGFGAVLATAGADSAIRLWALSEWLPADVLRHAAVPGSASCMGAAAGDLSVATAALGAAAGAADAQLPTASTSAAATHGASVTMTIA